MLATATDKITKYKYSMCDYSFVIVRAVPVLRLERHERRHAVGEREPERAAERELVVVVRAGDAQLLLVLVPLVVQEPPRRRHGQDLLPGGRRAFRLLPARSSALLLRSQTLTSLSRCLRVSVLHFSLFA